MIRRSFKSDDSFFEKISMGATGAIAIYNNLSLQGHRPIELERGSRSFKIWKEIKIKRIRVPDILCIDCGKCIECRAKTKLEISMSHSKSDSERAWDYGLNDEDLVAFVECKKNSNELLKWEINSPVQYVRIKDLRSSKKENQFFTTIPKGAGEGFELRLIWPSTTSGASGRISMIAEDRIQYRRETDNRTITLKLKKHEIPMNPLVVENEEIEQAQIIASVVPVKLNFDCNKRSLESSYIDLLNDISISKRYRAAKALSLFDSSQVTNALSNKLGDLNEHIYVRLEAASGLAHRKIADGYDFIENCLRDEFLQNRLEAVIVLGEIDTDESKLILIKTLMNNNQHAEIRAGAAWALGELKDRVALESLIESFSVVNNNIKIEAARSLCKLAENFTPEIIQYFSQTSPTNRPGISWALGKSGKFTISDMLGIISDEDSRHWISYMIGVQNKEKYIYEIEHLKEKDPEVYFAITVLWTIMNNWTWGLEEY